MNSYDIPNFKKTGFDSKYYKKLQKDDILKRLSKLDSGRLYLEIGGKLFFDPHAARVLPGFDPKVKSVVLQELETPFDIVFCMNYDDILSNRQLSNHQEDYVEASLKIVADLQMTFKTIPHICINNIKEGYKENTIFNTAIKRIYSTNPNVNFRYYIDGYPNNVEHILSAEGFGRDDSIPLQNKLVIVTGSASNSGKLSTCLGMIYKDHLKGMNSDYSKYETFPIWNLPLKHPVNLAYEAATADIGDRNVIDTYYQTLYGKPAVNYNRDVNAFAIIQKLIKSKYPSPTEMGISNAGLAIINDEVVCIAALQEIRRRRQWYMQINNKQTAWIKTCEELEEDALQYINTHGYDLTLQLEE